MERIIRNKNVDHMESNNLFAKQQHGFRAGRSSTTQLLEFMEEVTEAIDRGEEVDVIYSDFAKAFDKAPHKRLLSKLKGYGIKGNFYDWIKDFLSNRKQRVVINGKFSHWIRVTSGIPQGSVLGPIMFLIFINDLPDVLNCCMKLFADDAKLYMPIINCHDEEILQQNLHNSDIWAEIWDMDFNHNLIKDKLTELIERTFNREGSLYLACNDKNAFFTSEQPKRYKLWSCQKMCDALHYLLDNIFIRFGSKLYRQIVGIPMGTNCAPLVADLFLFVMREILCYLCQTIIKLILLKLLSLPPDI